MATVAYSLVIIYASLQPFTGWRVSPLPFGAFLSAPWPRWITSEDIVFNLAAYLPLGFLLALALCVRLHPRSAVLLAALCCAMLSFVLEAIQQYLPMRIASSVDLLVNACGGAAGALLAPLFAPGRRLGEAFALLRNRWFIGGVHGDAVLVLAALWLLTQLHVAPISMGAGDLRGSLELAALFRYTPESYRYIEAGVVMFNVTAVGLLLASAARSIDAGYWRSCALLLAAACALKAAAVLLITRAAQPWSWLTPGLAIGFAAAAVLLLALVRLPPRGRAAAAIVALLCAVALVNLAPDYPYRNVPLNLLPGRTGHLLNFTNMIRALSDLWPFLTLLSLAAGITGRQAARTT